MTVLSRMMYGMIYELPKDQIGKVPFYLYHMNRMFEDGIIQVRLAESEAQRRVAFLTIYRLANKLVKDNKSLKGNSLSDRNGDGKVDIFQANVITTTNPVTNSYNTLETDSCVVADFNIIRDDQNDSGYIYPL